MIDDQQVFDHIKRIGIFGGTFNPVHAGHLRVAQEIKKRFALDKICLVPSALPPHKTYEGLADAKDRLEMIRLAVADNPDDMNCFTVSDVELKRSGPSYTIDTIYCFKSIFPENTKFYLILGFDAFLEIDTWKSYPDLFRLVPFIVMARPGIGYNDAALMQKTLEKHLQSKISAGYRFSSSRSCYVHTDKQPVYVSHGTPIDISSTKIRQFINKGKSIKSLVSENVEDFIKIKGFYV